jgi:hypothetical protein
MVIRLILTFRYLKQNCNAYIFVVTKLHTKDSKIVHDNLSFPNRALLLYFQIHQQYDDWNVLCYVYYYLPCILSDNGSQG